jgi:hypothetical protein
MSKVVTIFVWPSYYITKLSLIYTLTSYLQQHDINWVEPELFSCCRILVKFLLLGFGALNWALATSFHYVSQDYWTIPLLRSWFFSWNNTKVAKTCVSVVFPSEGQWEVQGLKLFLSQASDMRILKYPSNIDEPISHSSNLTVRFSTFQNLVDSSKFRGWLYFSWFLNNDILQNLGIFRLNDFFFYCYPSTKHNIFSEDQPRLFLLRD